MITLTHQQCLQGNLKLKIKQKTCTYIFISNARPHLIISHAYWVILKTWFGNGMK